MSKDEQNKSNVIRYHRGIIFYCFIFVRIPIGTLTYGNIEINPILLSSTMCILKTKHNMPSLQITGEKNLIKYSYP